LLPGPRWLPFGGDSSGLCEKPLTKIRTRELVDQFGPVVGLRPGSAPRNPLVLVLDAASAESLEDAVKKGFLQTKDDCFHGFTGKKYWVEIYFS